MRYSAALLLILAGVWLCWSGIFDNRMILALGALSCVIVVLIARRMGLVDAEGVPLRIALRLPLYAPWIVWEVVKANVDVARRILNPALPIDPRVIEVAPGQQTDLGRVIYANSITLTPGTVSMGVEEDCITVHALTREAAEDLETGRMDRKVSWLEGA